MVLWDEIGPCRKTIFQAPKKCFFAHAWTASNPRKINTWVDFGTWNIVFPKNLKKNWGFADKQFFELRKIAFSHILGLLPIHAHAWTFQPLLNAQKVPHRDSNPRPGPTGWQLRYRSLALKRFCFLILSLCFGCKGLGLAWVAVATKKLRDRITPTSQAPPMIRKSGWSGTEKEEKT